MSDIRNAVSFPQTLNGVVLSHFGRQRLLHSHTLSHTVHLQEILDSRSAFRVLLDEGLPVPLGHLLA